MTKLSFSILASLTLSLAACGKVVPLEGTDGGAPTFDGGGDTTPDADVKAACDSPIAFEDLGDCLLEAQCQQLERCSPTFLDIEECRANLGVLSGDLTGQLIIFENAIDAGKADYDGVAAAACLESLATATCSQDGEQPDCEQVFRGTTPPNGQCLEAFECGEIGSQCDNAGCDGSVQCCTGFCDPPVDIGQACDSAPCKLGDHCVRSNTPGQIDTCQSGDDGSPCSENFECDDNFFCEPDQAICVPTRPAGADCATQDECSGDDDCVAGVCGSVDTAGAPCSDFCLGSLGCLSGTCTALPSEGQNCTNFDQCNSVTLDCVGTQNLKMCIQKQGLGDACGVRQCQPGLLCEDDLPSPPAVTNCVMPLPDGAQCDRDSHCASSQCQLDQGANVGTCVAPQNCYETL